FFIETEHAKDQAIIGQGGGLVGFALSKFLREAFSSLGAFFILLAGLITGILITSNTPVGWILDKIRAGIDFIKELIARWRNREATDDDYLPNQTEEKEVAVTAKEEEKREKEEPSIKVVASLSEPTTMRQITGSSRSKRTQDSQSGDLHHETVVNKRDADQVWKYPPLSLLSSSEDKGAERGDVSKNARIIEDTLDSFGIKAKVAEINLGPSVTQYALSYTQGTKISKIRNLQNDLAMTLASPTGS
ncbi:unnamed protein product, partial [marine sediment metagenome]